MRPIQAASIWLAALVLSCANGVGAQGLTADDRIRWAFNQSRAAPRPAVPSRTYAIRAARLIDGKGDAAIANAVVVVRDSLIVAVGTRATVPIPPDAEIIELGDETIMPGMLDGHTHVAGRAESTGSFGQRERWQQDNGIQMSRALRHARLNLLSGVTTCRVAGDPARTDFMTRDAIDGGLAPGCRIMPSGNWVTTTNGGTVRKYRVDGVQDLVKLVRNNIEDGADHIKVYMQAYSDGGTNYTNEEIKAVVDETHRLGRYVMAHASGKVAMMQAINAGVDNIEHADQLTDELIQILVDRKIPIGQTTMSGYQFYLDEGWPYQDYQSTSIADWAGFIRRLMKKADDTVPRRHQQTVVRYAELMKAHRAGVPIYVGLDNFPGLISMELEFLVAAGFTPMEAIKAATSVAATAFRLGDRTGTIEAGKWADIISVKGDPLKDFGQMSSVHFMMVGGKNYTGISYR